MPNNMDISSSLSIFKERQEYPGSQRWNDIKKFVIIAATYSNAIYNFDIFSKVVYKVRIFEFVFWQITVGMAYMFMDCFMSLYTRKADSHKYLNPLLKGITCGLFLQNAIWIIVHGSYTADSLRYLAASFRETPPWASCHLSVNVSCVNLKNLVSRCHENEITDFAITSASHNYQISFKQHERNVLMSRFFVTGLVWICNFFFSTVTETTSIKLFKLTFVFRTVFTIATLLFLLITNTDQAVLALTQLLDVNVEYSCTSTIEHISYAYGIGFLAFSDYGMVSTYTMVDNGIILFTIVFTFFAFLRSWIIRALYLTLTQCVTLKQNITPHFLLFAVVPLSTDFFHAHYLYIVYIYGCLIVNTIIYQAMLTMTMAKLINTEFRSVKSVYIIGVICFLGFTLSLPFTVSMFTGVTMRGLVTGLNMTVLYLGGFKVAVIMWVYGVQRFSIDIHFWLGFKPTKFWIFNWILMPIVLACFLITKIYELSQRNPAEYIVTGSVWFGLTLLLVAIIHIRTVVKYLLQNNLAAVFRSTAKYGPPDPTDRMRRRNFDETIHLRKCRHICQVLDESIECNHLPLVSNLSMHSGSDSSMKDIFEGIPLTRYRSSLTLDIQSHH